MTGFLTSLGLISAYMSVIILILLVCFRLFGKRYSARCRYLIWAVVAVRLALVVALPSMFDIEVELPAREATAPSVRTPAAEIGASPYTPPVTARDDPVQPELSPRTQTEQEIAPPVNVGREQGVPAEPAEAPAAAVFPQTSEITQIPQTNAVRAADPVDALPAAIFTIWAAGALAFAAYNAAGYHRAKRRISYTLADPSDRVTELYLALAESMKIKCPPRLMISCEPAGPMLYGFIRPVIVIPDIGFEAESAAWVLCHELTHFKRRHLWIKLIGVAARSLHWFNPLAHAAAGQLERAMELSCDEEVLRGKSERERSEYGNTLIRIIRECNFEAASLTTSFNPGKKTVKERFENVMNTAKKRAGRIAIGAVLILSLIVGVIGFTACDPKSLEADDTASDTRPVITDPDNPNGLESDISDFKEPSERELSAEKAAYAYWGLTYGSDNEMELYIDGVPTLCPVTVSPAAKNVTIEGYGQGYMTFLLKANVDGEDRVVDICASSPDLARAFRTVDETKVRNAFGELRQIADIDGLPGEYAKTVTANAGFYGYVLRDVTGDGIDELFIVDDDYKVERIFDFTSGGAREDYSNPHGYESITVTDDGIIVRLTENAYGTRFVLMTIAPEGGLQGIETLYFDDGIIGYTSVDAGGFRTALSWREFADKIVKYKLDGMYNVVVPLKKPEPEILDSIEVDIDGDAAKEVCTCRRVDSENGNSYLLSVTENGTVKSEAYFFTGSSALDIVREHSGDEMDEGWRYIRLKDEKGYWEQMTLCLNDEGRLCLYASDYSALYRGISEGELGGAGNIIVSISDGNANDSMFENYFPNAPYITDIFYEDNDFRYMFISMKSELVRVRTLDGRDVSISRALKDGILTPDEYNKAGFEFWKYDKKTRVLSKCSFTVISPSECPQPLVVFSSDAVSLDDEYSWWINLEDANINGSDFTVSVRSDEGDYVVIRVGFGPTKNRLIPGDSLTIVLTDLSADENDPLYDYLYNRIFDTGVYLNEKYVWGIRQSVKEGEENIIEIYRMSDEKVLYKYEVLYDAKSGVHLMDITEGFNIPVPDWEVYWHVVE